MFRNKNNNRASNVSLAFSDLSFDIVVSVFANLIFFTAYFQTELRLTLLLFYLISVWALYLADHLWDAKKEIAPLSRRSQFYLQNQSKVQWAIGILFVLALLLGFVWEWKFLIQNQTYLFCFLIVLVLVVKQLSPVPKEILVSVFYTWGILLPFSNTKGLPMLVVSFFLHVLANVLQTYRIDRERDKIQNTNTLNLWLSPHLAKGLAILVFLSGFTFLCFGFHSQTIPFVFFLGMGLSYLWLGLTWYFFPKPSYLKLFSELSYLPMFLPPIIFFFSGLR
ncbi:prenyltransferase [Leptospira levettii]|uniref:Prenyltransferase n=1 Tax=Leptospira levettii TaxID=2023178 RepID=A0AAW5V424_9LEPT|nr:prenyltransferase [Leptospira levettii]MCW7464357.1 prenyltransferase [Leptospira levettii]MCW7511458.1 prenyltransferase [Leptospira levettii]MCW7515213.1 prenyltransferase [Leptospira levettii]